MSVSCSAATQKIIFETARDVYENMQQGWKGSREALLAQVVRLVEQFIRSDLIEIVPGLFEQDDLKRRLLITLNMTKVVQHIWGAIRADNTEKLEPVFDRDRPIRSTGDMGTWYTGKPCAPAQRSHINFCVFDSTWEATEAFELDRNPAVSAWVKNDHLVFEVLYIHRGVVRKYRPDFLIRLVTGEHLVFETKGQDTDQDKTKRRFLEEWVERRQRARRLWSVAVRCIARPRRRARHSHAARECVEGAAAGVSRLRSRHRCLVNPPAARNF